MGIPTALALHPPPATSSPTCATAASGGASNFASGLSALISQVSNGQAPAALQSAFTQLASDLQGSRSATAGTSSATTGTATSTTQATLQALLTQMQQNLGYASSNTALSNTLIGQA